MTEPRNDSLATSQSGAAPEQLAAPRDRPPSRTLPRLRGREGWGRIAIELAGALLLVVALIATGPLWAPLLPWSAAPVRNDAELEPRIDRVEAAVEQSRRQSQQAEAAANAALQGLDRRVAALEASSAAPASDVAEMRRQVAQLGATTADLTTRVAAIDKTVHSEAAGDPTDIALVLALLEIRDAVEVGRPFAAAYETLAALAHARPEIAAAAAPLAEPATTGVAARPVLADRLRELAGAIATVGAAPKSAPENAPGATQGWADQALSRLRGLVTIRRVGEPATGPSGGSVATAVNAALRALAGGDLEGAVGALDAMTGAPAEVARPWLRMAKERLAVEAALQQIEALLVARLGNAANAAAGSAR
jgi:hypothetical protein